VAARRRRSTRDVSLTRHAPTDPSEPRSAEN
jgi:hypothetical protein